MWNGKMVDYYIKKYVEKDEYEPWQIESIRYSLLSIMLELVIHPESTLNVHSTQEEKETAGVFDDLIRISVGIEDIDDLIDDFKQAIESVKDVY